MMDMFKKLAGKVVEGGAAYMRHNAAIERILSSATPEIGVEALRNHIFTIEDKVDFALFKAAVGYQHGLARNAQANADNAWGNSFEDRLAYRMARIQSGESGSSTAAQQRQAYLEAIAQLADQFWGKAHQNRPPPVDPAAIAR
jgi:hypothetical protein